MTSLKFDAWNRVLKASALGQPRGMGWGRRWDEGSGWGNTWHPWLIHVNVWQKKTIKKWEKYLNRQFAKADIQIANKHIKRCSTSLILQFSSVAQSCTTLYDPMNCSMSGLPVHHQLLESTQTQVRWISDAIQPSHPLSSPSLPALNLSFQMSQLFTSSGQSIGVSSSTSVLPMNTQDWSLLGWTGWISLQSEELSRVFSNTTVQKHQFFGTQLSSQSNSHIHTWLLEKP